MTDTRPPETDSQRACREWWQAREPHVTRAWGRDTKTGAFLAESSRALHAAWEAAGLGRPPRGVPPPPPAPMRTIRNIVRRARAGAAD